jgi:hypothetical protein
LVFKLWSLLRAAKSVTTLQWKIEQRRFFKMAALKNLTIFQNRRWKLVVKNIKTGQNRTVS